MGSSHIEWREATDTKSAHLPIDNANPNNKHTTYGKKEEQEKEEQRTCVG